MNLHQLQLFCAVVESGSFARASRDILISQPALSIQIKRLETSLGVELLHRGRGGVTLTPSGAELYESARAILQHAEAAERRVKAIRSGEAGALEIGVGHNGVLYFVTDLVKAMRHRLPRIQVTIDVLNPARAMEKLATGALDAEFTWDHPLPPDLESTALLDVPFGVVCSPEHPCAERGVITRAEFLGSTYITIPRGISVVSFPEIESWLAERGDTQAMLADQPSIDAVKRLVEANLGIAILSRISVERELAAGSLAWLEMDGYRPSRQVSLITSCRFGGALLDQLKQFARDFAASRHLQ
jgi:LysR family transcriptional regulator, low CO2-responsive transcriptional regulator